jgi:hypothetical protein
MPLAAGVPAGNRGISGGILRSAACFFGRDCAILYARLKEEAMAMKQNCAWMKGVSIALMASGFIVLGVYIFDTGASKGTGIFSMILMCLANVMNMIREKQEKKKEEKTDEK